jgi:uncharacterized protein (DUF885 family)
MVRHEVVPGARGRVPDRRQPDPPVRPTRSPVDRLADQYLHDLCAVDPVEATFLGLQVGGTTLDDLSPTGTERRILLAQQAQAAVRRADAQDIEDSTTLLAMDEHAQMLLTRHTRIRDGLDPTPLNVLTSPVQRLCDVFTLMEPTRSPDAVVQRLLAVPSALDGYRRSLLVSASKGAPAPRRQVLACRDQCRRQAGPAGTFARLGRVDHPLWVPAVAAAQDAYASLAVFFERELLATCTDEDGCGPERYAVESWMHLGTVVDPRDAYAWAQEELADLVHEQTLVAARVTSGADPGGAADALDRDPRYQLPAEDLCDWLAERSAEAVAAVDGVFALPGPVGTLEAVTTSDGGPPHYSEPSEDGSRPGTLWWPEPRTPTVSTWRELTTVHHEGIPGHHLQAVLRPRGRNRWRRTMTGPSGCTEGWALYAERLMAELGAMDDPGFRLGYLESRALRLARVVLDIGMHCQLPPPPELGSNVWTYAAADRYLARHSRLDGAGRRFELDRYLGWPGQAASYALGERCWLELRERRRHRLGPSSSLAAFHTAALRLGGLGLDGLQTALDDIRPTEGRD